MSSEITESQFYMWRTIFALSHADDVVTDEELRFMAETLEDVPFSESQHSILKNDTQNPKDVKDMFQGITDPVDQAEFFEIARELVHIDGDYGEEEQEVMLDLITRHVTKTDLDDLVGKVDLEFEGDAKSVTPSDNTQNESFKDKVYSFRQRFLKKLSGEAY